LSICFFVSDLHGHTSRYCKLFDKILQEKPAAVFLGGDLLPHGLASASYAGDDFIGDFLVKGFSQLQEILKDDYPRVFVILGNDDGRLPEEAFMEAESRGIWHYIQNTKVRWLGFDIYGYAYVPPTPFQLKDWDRYDVSRYVDPGCISPEEGFYTRPVPDHDKRYATIQKDLEQLAGSEALDRAVFLFHSPPYQTKLDRLSGHVSIRDHAPLDAHAGSIAVKRFIETRQPRITLHGHIHESARITGCWKEQIGRTWAFSAAHDGPELALVRFSTEEPEGARRELI
jgi:Icc-related predicted phosphoesterase